MAKTQRLHDVLTGSPSLEYLNHMNASGWKLVALDWERESGVTEQDAPDEHTTAHTEEVPYGLQISDDGYHLIENPVEMRVLMHAVNLIVDDSPLSGAADELNRQGFRTRKGAKWTATSVFNLLPRMIETGPRIFTKEEWVERRRHLMRD